MAAKNQQPQWAETRSSYQPAVQMVSKLASRFFNVVQPIWAAGRQPVRADRFIFFSTCFNPLCLLKQTETFYLPIVVA